MRTPRVLIVDDEQDVLAILGKRFGREGYEVYTTDNGQDALKLAREHHPDLIVLDVLIPGMFGGEIASRLKNDPQTRHIPVYFLSCLFTQDEPKCQSDIHDSVAKMMYAKPYELDEMLQNARMMLAQTSEN